jgi:hypothetical protein
MPSLSLALKPPIIALRGETPHQLITTPFFVSEVNYIAANQ